MSDKDLEQQDTEKNKTDVSEEKDKYPVFDDDFGPDRVWEDDGQVSFADMDLTRPVHAQKRTARLDLQMTKKEMRALRRAAFLHYLKPMLCVLFGFGVAIAVVTLWLSQ